MKISLALFFCMTAASGFAQTDSAVLTVLSDSAVADKHLPKRVNAILPKGERGNTDEFQKIRFYRQRLPFELKGANGVLAWFSYTNPPKDKRAIFVEADQTTFGSFLLRDRLYVCSLRSLQSSVPVMNALLSSVSSVSLTEAEARSIAFLFAKCSDTLQIYGDDKAAFISAEAQQQMEKIAKPPTSENRNGDISVVFYSWSALPAGEVSKWTFLFRGNEVVSVKREPVSTNANEGSLYPAGNTLLHESGHVADPPKPQ